MAASPTALFPQVVRQLKSPTTSAPVEIRAGLIGPPGAPTLDGSFFDVVFDQSECIDLAVMASRREGQ
jgi:hypothetical protein